MSDKESVVGVSAPAVDLDHVDTKKLDVAGAFLAEVAARPDAAELLAPYTKEEEKKLVGWKIDPIMMTLCQFAGMMGAVDKVCIGTAALLNWRQDTGMVGQDYSWSSSIIYFGAILAVIPSMIAFQKLPSGKWVAFNCFVWGILLVCMSQAKSWATIMVVRFILGLFESVIFAGFGLIVAQWWTRKEQGWRTAVIFSTLSSVMNGILSYAALEYGTKHKLKGWQLLFIMVGVITIAWSFVLATLLPDNPSTAWWLTMREKVIAIRRTESNRTGMESQTFKLSQVKEAAMDPKTYLFFLIAFLLNIPNGGLITFNSIVIATLGFTTKQTTLLAIPTGVISWISSIAMGVIGARTGKRFIVTLLGTLLPLIGTIILHLVPRTNRGGSLTGLYILWMYWGPYTSAQTIMYSNTAGFTKKYCVFAFAYMGYCVGNITGPLTFKASQAPTYSGGIVAMLCGYIIAWFLVLVLYLYTIYLNKKKEQQLAEYEATRVGKEDLLEEWHDLTDWENPRFRYVT
ncbi:allantoate permease [Pseudohyphozyma bogoriensis]|nr:allantoate permease [Pseudohyphozyma bogoriensis]